MQPTFAAIRQTRERCGSMWETCALPPLVESCDRSLVSTRRWLRALPFRYTKVHYIAHAQGPLSETVTHTSSKSTASLVPLTMCLANYQYKRCCSHQPGGFLFVFPSHPDVFNRMISSRWLVSIAAGFLIWIWFRFLRIFKGKGSLWCLEIRKLGDEVI